MGYFGAILGLYRDNGKENGNYYSIFRAMLDPCMMPSAQDPGSCGFQRTATLEP